MNQDYYQFYVGDFKCTAINDCKGLVITDSPKSSFSNASNEAFNEAARVHGFNPTEWEREVFMHCLLVETGSRRILFDVGMGTPDRYSGAGKLHSALAKAGVAAETIDTVIFTHGHWDHVAGLADEAGKLLFPNADYLMQSDEWAFWTDRNNMRLLNPNHAAFDMISFDRLPLIRERVQLFEPEGEIIPGVHAIAVPGHTPGHTVFSIISKDQELLHISDLVHTSLHFEYPEWHHEVDILPELSAASRRKIFSRAAAENLLIFGCHTNSDSGLGHIKPKGNTWTWQPLTTL